MVEQREKNTLSYTFYGVASGQEETTVALDGVGGAEAVDGSVLKGVNDAVKVHVTSLFENGDLDTLQQLRSREDVLEDFGQDGDVIGITATTVTIGDNGIMDIDSTFEDLTAA